MKIQFLALAAAAAASFIAADAQAVTVVSYDVTHAQPSGYGNWAHSYTGTITSGAPGVTYSGGSGTLNADTVGSGAGQTQLFQTSYAPTITLHLDNVYTISAISFLTNVPYNGIPGNLTSVDVTIDGATQSVALSALGGTNELASLSGLLSRSATNTILLSNFATTGRSFGEYFSIGKIQVDGAVAAVPEPATWAMMLAGFGLIGFAARRRPSVKTTVTFA